MQRRNADASFYTTESSRKSRGDFFYDESDHEVDDVRPQREVKQRRHDDRCGDRYDEASCGPRKPDQRLVFRKLGSRGVARRHDCIPKTETPYLSYRAAVQENQVAPSPPKLVDANDDKRDISVRGGDSASGVVSESSYYGDTSVEALSVTAKTVSSLPGARRNGDKKKAERGPCRGDHDYMNADTCDGSGANQKAKNGGGALCKNADKRNGNAPNANGNTASGHSNGQRNSVQESELLATGAASLLAKMKIKQEDEKKGVQRIHSPRTFGGVFGEECAVDGLLPADASLEKLEKEAGLGYATYKANALPMGEEVIRTSSQSTVVGLPAPEFRLRSPDEGRGMAASVGTGKLKKVEAKGMHAFAEESFVEKRATEQRSRRRNGQKTLPIEEPVVVPAVSIESMATTVYPQSKNESEDVIVKCPAVVTGKRYPEGRDSYYRRDIEVTATVGRPRRSDENSGKVPAEVYEGFDVTDDEIRCLLESKSGNGSGRKTERTGEYKTASSGGPSSLPYSSSASGKKNSSRFVFKMQRARDSDMELKVDHDCERDETFKSCRTGGSVKLSSQTRGGSSSDRYVSARGEPEGLRDVAHNAPSYRTPQIEQHLETEYSDAESDETLTAGENDSQFASAASRWTEGKDDPRMKLQREQAIDSASGRLVRESTRMERKFACDALRQTDGEYVTASGGDESPSLCSELQSWSIVSTSGSFEGDDRRRLVNDLDNEEGTTSFSLASSCWCPTPTPTCGSQASGRGYFANAWLDSPLMGDFRSRRNILQRRSHSSLHVALRSLQPATQIQAESPVLVVFGGINPEDPMREDLGSAVLRYLFDDDEWQLCCFMPQARSYHTTALVRNRIYVFGGFNLDALEYQGPTPSAHCFCLDIERMVWKKCPPMKQARACHVCVVIGPRIYVVGGKDNTGR